MNLLPLHVVLGQAYDGSNEAADAFPSISRSLYDGGKRMMACRFVNIGGRTAILKVFALGVYVLASRVHAQAPDLRLQIEVQLRRLTGDPIPSARASDFDILADGIRHDVSTLQPERKSGSRVPQVPQHLLLMGSPRSAYRSVGFMVQRMRGEAPPSLSGWQVAMTAPDGTATAFQLADDIFRGVPVVVSSRGSSIPGAMASLGRFRGRRAIFYFVGAYESVPKNVRQSAETIGALIYQIGGDLSMNDTSYGEPTTTSLPAYGAGLYSRTFESVGSSFVVYNNAELYENHSVASVRTVRVEPDLRHAAHDLTVDGRGWYQLTLPLPVGVQHVSLRLRNVTEYQVWAEAYTIDGTPPPELGLALR